MNPPFNDIADGRISAFRLAALLQGNTYASLLVEHGTPVVPLREVSSALLGMTPERACVLAKRGALSVPVFRAGGPRSPWLLHLFDLAQHIDAQRADAGSTHITATERAVA